MLPIVDSTNTPGSSDSRENSRKKIERDVPLAMLNWNVIGGLVGECEADSCEGASVDIQELVLLLFSYLDRTT